MLKLFKDSFVGPYFVSVMWALITGLKDKFVGHRLGTSYQFAMTGKTKPNNLGKARKKLHTELGEARKACNIKRNTGGICKKLDIGLAGKFWQPRLLAKSVPR